MLQHLITWVFQLSILATAFSFGLKATTEDVQDLIRRPALLGRSLLAIFVIVPIVAVALAHAFDFPHAAEIAMIALAISPLATLIPVNLIKVGRRFSFPAGLMAMVALLSVVVVPLLVALVGRFLGWSLVSPLRAAGVVAAIVLLPLVAGMVVRALRPVLADRIELPTSLVGTIVLRLATLALLLTSLHAILALIVNGTVIAIAVVVAVGFAAGHVLGGPHPDGRTVLALAGGFRHPAVALATAAASSSEPHFTAAIVLYLLFGDIVGLPYTIWRQRSRGSLTYAEAAAIILDAREKAVDDLRAGRAAPYYLAPSIEPNPSSSATLPSSANGGDSAKGDENR
jgi:bile acid:Na+ symporter, BASS family